MIDYSTCKKIIQQKSIFEAESENRRIRYRVCEGL